MIPGTISTVTTVPSQMSSLFYKRKVQLKPDVYVNYFGGLMEGS